MKKRKTVFQEGCLQLNVNMKVARLVPLALHGTVPLSSDVTGINAQAVDITAKVVFEEKTNSVTKHPSFGKSVHRLLSVRNREDKAVHRNLLLSGTVAGYIPCTESCGGGELYRVMWDNIDEQQWLNYMEVAKCTALKWKSRLLTITVTCSPRRKDA